MLERIAEHSRVPVINALTDDSHPCQILADLQTIREKRGSLEGCRIAYLGDAQNNVTTSLLLGCSRLGVSVTVGSPDDAEFRPRREVLEAARAGARGAEILVTDDPDEAVAGAEFVYTDSWMSYHIAKEEESRRVGILGPYQVDEARMARAAPDALFMNCLPAMRGFEQTAEVIDGPRSIVFDQAENRLHAQKALLLHLLPAVS
jgi:ornithine carbamoyltransferase